MAPITSLGQNLTRPLALFSLLVTEFPQWENGKRGENGSFVYFLLQNRLGGLRSTG